MKIKVNGRLAPKWSKLKNSLGAIHFVNNDSLWSFRFTGGKNIKISINRYSQWVENELTTQIVRLFIYED